MVRDRRRAAALWGLQPLPVRLELPYRLGLKAHASRDHALAEPLWEGCRENNRCSRHTYTESYISKYTSIPR